MAHARGRIRDAVVDYLTAVGSDAPLVDIERAVQQRLGPVSGSSVRSSIYEHPSVIERTSRGRYRLRVSNEDRVARLTLTPAVEVGQAKLFHEDCFRWLSQQDDNSIHAVVTDPPYGVVEYQEAQVRKLREGRGGVWRVPPSFDGHRRSPLPRFTTLTPQDKEALSAFFRRLGAHLVRKVVPGANIIVASNPLLSHMVAGAMSEAGLEPRGYISRLVMTMRGGDRPKNAHEEFAGVSMMPRSQWEPWIIMRRPLEGRAQDNLRKWGTGGFRRISDDQPFGDVVRSSPTPRREKEIAPHPSLKPQQFLRHVVRASLPLGEGIVLDPFAGSGSTLAAANAVGYASLGVESDAHFVRVADLAIGRLGNLEFVYPV
jgi:site-specific DNA-methyltransferase (adenine-specific)